MNLDAEEAIPYLECAEHQAVVGGIVSEQVIRQIKGLFALKSWEIY